ncbi:MAG: hypothetical protein N3B21_08695 [Clostridia bacterium]|nr:hypothetical protein [Clostridia bacterium]
MKGKKNISAAFLSIAAVSISLSMITGCSQENIFSDVGNILVSDIETTGKKAAVAGENDVKEEENYKELTLSKETKHFLIQYGEKEKPYINEFAIAVEKSYQDLYSIYHIDVKEQIKINIYSSLKELHRVIGGSGTDQWLTGRMFNHTIWMSSPIGGSGNYSYETQLYDIPKHELTHIFVQSMSGSERSHITRWFDEAIALHHGRILSQQLVDSGIKSKLKANEIPSFEDMETYYDAFLRDMGYVFAATIGDFLVETYGYNKIKTFIQNPTDYEGAFGVTKNELWEKWVGYLKEKYKS